MNFLRLSLTTKVGKHGNGSLLGGFAIEGISGGTSPCLVKRSMTFFDENTLESSILSPPLGKCFDSNCVLATAGLISESSISTMFWLMALWPRPKVIFQKHRNKTALFERKRVIRLGMQHLEWKIFNCWMCILSILALLQTDWSSFPSASGLSSKSG